MFLLIIEGLNKSILQAKREGKSLGLKITNHCTISLPFVDNVLIFLNGGIRDFFVLYDILMLFSVATGMESNRFKYIIFFSAFPP